MPPSKEDTPRAVRWILPLGDSLALALVVVYGFASHQEVEAVFTARFLATYLPFLAAWLLSAAVFGALNPARAGDARQLWRPAVAGLVSAPIGALLRSAWLGTPPVPTFIAVMTVMLLIGLGLWRVALFAVLRLRGR
jgi:hypothetical protein